MKLYTKTVCPKCMLLKSTMTHAEVIDKVEIINLDDNPEVKEWLQSEESGNPYFTLPIFHHNDEFYTDTPTIMSILTTE